MTGYFPLGEDGDRAINIEFNSRYISVYGKKSPKISYKKWDNSK